MPPLCIHLSVAKETATHLCQPILQQNMGLYLLGATLPDIHFVTGNSRESTHFFDLATGSLQSGVSSFLQNHSRLSRQAQLDSAQKVLVAGYLSHLITDELWVTDIYRPFFGPASPLKGEAMANVLDRALQFELDSQVRRQQDRIQEFGSLLAQQNWEVASYFADSTSLKRWREFVFSILGCQLSWDSSPSYARSFLLSRQKVAPEQLDMFVTSLPQMLKDALNIVPQKKIESSIQAAINASATLTKEYVS